MPKHRVPGTPRKPSEGGKGVHNCYYRLSLSELEMLDAIQTHLSSDRAPDRPCSQAEALRWLIVNFYRTTVAPKQES